MSLGRMRAGEQADQAEAYTAENAAHGERILAAALPANSRRPRYIYEAHKVAGTAAYIAA